MRRPLRRRLCQSSLIIVALACVRCTLLVDTSSLTESAGASPKDEVTENDASTNNVLADTGPVETSDDAGDDGRAAFPDGVTVWPENGHGYLVVIAAAPLRWTAANAAAEARGGHLVTITSEDEAAFVMSLLVAHPEAFKGSYGPWLGGHQRPDAGEPDGGWGWVTGESWAYTAWAPNEPNEGRAGEDFLNLFSHARPHDPTWSDVADNAGEVVSYIVEFD